ncbi:MAG: TaqI-like C-terminal specificity domain-containing protein [Thermodesulfobacteriota bacterium]|nr:TaqI-like C-terminal specificity domain-containing protein [Thermodesulfobacteriota bacterium]
MSFRVLSRTLTKCQQFQRPNMICLQGEGVFVLNYHEYKTLKLNAEERNFVRPFFDECDIHKYLIRPQEEKCLIYLTPFNCKNIDTLPNLKKHLIKYKQIMDVRRETKKGVNKWFHLHWPRREEQFAKKKLILPAMFKRQNVGYMETEGYFGLSSNIIIQKNTNYSLKYILAILNSSLAFDWFYRYGKKRGVGVDIGVNKLRTFPVKKLSLKFQETFKDCVDCILSITKGDDYLQNSQKQAEVKALEKEIDQFVYQLYDLTPEEIKIVEGNGL